MVAIVDREGCIGCTLCTGVCPEVFQMEDGLAQGGPVPTGLESAAADAADSCPVSVIRLEYPRKRHKKAAQFPMGSGAAFELNRCL